MAGSSYTRQNPHEITEHRLVTLAGGSTSLDFGQLVHWHGAQSRAATFFVPGTVVISGAATYDLSQMDWLQLLAEATDATKWRLRGQFSLIEACQEFAELLHDVTEVESVVCTSDDGTTHIWTYLDANPFDRSTRYSIYDAEDGILDRYPDAEIEFHLTNLAEHPPEMREGLRKAGSVIYERPNAIEE